MIPRTALILVAAAGLALAACGSDSSTSDAPASDETLAPIDTTGTTDPAAPIDTTDSGGAAADTVTADDLDGRTFEATAVEGHELVADSTITLSFVENALRADAGCNGMFGAFEIDGDALVAENLASTMMFCDGLMDQESWVSALLTSSPTIALDGETLTLTGTDGAITFAEVPKAEIEGTTWTVTDLIIAGFTSGVTPMPAEASMTFADGEVALNTGCNTGGGEATITDAAITFGPLRTTLIACEGDVGEFEAYILSVLDGAVRYTIEGNVMELTNAEGRGLQLTAD